MRSIDIIHLHWGISELVIKSASLRNRVHITLRLGSRVLSTLIIHLFVYINTKVNEIVPINNESTEYSVRTHQPFTLDTLHMCWIETGLS